MLGTGQLEESARSVTHAKGAAAVSNLTNLRGPSGEILGYGGNDTDFWHSDQEFRRYPATIAMLYCLIPADGGGETTFASTRLENIQLDPCDVAALEAVWYARQPAPDHDNTPQVLVSHPAVLSHPRAPYRSLYVTEHCHAYTPDGTLQGDDSLPQRILRVITEVKNTYTHIWQAGDLLIFDNTQFVHRRERFLGLRWLKSLKIFAPPDQFCIPSGTILRDLSLGEDGG